MSRASHRTLAEHFRALPDESLVALLRARPDLAVPVPADISVLATRAHSRSSVARALDQLDQFTLEILDGLRLGPETAEELTKLVGGAAPAEAVEGALDRLLALGLVWLDGETLCLAAGINEVCSPYPAGLGRPVATLAAGMGGPQLTPILRALDLPASTPARGAALIAEVFEDPARVNALIAAAPQEAQAVLRRLATGPPIGAVRDARRTVPAAEADTPVRWLLAHALLVALDNESVELPREVGIVLRGERVLGDLHPQPPEVPAIARPKKESESAGAAQAVEVVRLVEALLGAIGDDPPGVLRSGGIGVRDLRRISRAAGVEERAVPLLLEVARAAGLLDDTGEAEPEWLPTPSYDSWREDALPLRWERLARAWLGMTRLAGIIGQRDEKDRIVAPLSFEAERVGAPELRKLVLGVLSERPRGAVTAEHIDALLHWRAPRRGGRRREEAVRWALDEAATLGITGRGALTTFGAALLSDGSEPAQLLGALLPPPLDHVLVQADLTVVAPGPLQPELAAQIGLVADVESAGGATVYRVTAASVRRALDAGRSAGELHQLFAQRSRTPIPQSLTYLIDDVARRHGGLRTGAGAAYLRSDDESLLAEILADRRCELLRLRRLAPTVLISPMAPNRMLEILRAAGYAPVAEDAYGALVLARADVRRASVRVRPTRPGADLPVLGDRNLAEAVRAVRSGEDRARNARRAPVTTSELPGGGAATALAVLQHAARERKPVWLGYVDAHGGTLSRFVRPLSLGAGYLRAEDETAEISLTIALHRITSAALGDDVNAER